MLKSLDKQLKELGVKPPKQVLVAQKTYQIFLKFAEKTYKKYGKI